MTSSEWQWYAYYIQKKNSFQNFLGIPRSRSSNCKRHDFAYQPLLAINSSCVPLSTTSPPSPNTRIMSQFCTDESRWATIIAVAPSCTRFMMAFVTKFSVTASKLDVASSISKILDPISSLYNARARQTLCLSPPDNSL